MQSGCLSCSRCRSFRCKVLVGDKPVSIVPSQYLRGADPKRVTQEGWAKCKHWAEWFMQKAHIGTCSSAPTPFGWARRSLVHA